MQPHPVSDVNPCDSMSWLRRRTPSVSEDRAFGSSDFGMMGKLERYVSQIRDSMSSRKASGQPLSLPSSDLAPV